MSDIQKTLLFIGIVFVAFIFFVVVVAVCVKVTDILRHRGTVEDFGADLDRAAETVDEAKTTAGDLERTVEEQREIIEQIKKQRIEE